MTEMKFINMHTIFEFLAILFRIFEFFGDCDLDLLPKVTIFELDLTTDTRHHLQKPHQNWSSGSPTSVLTDRQTDAQTHAHTHIQTN